MIRYQTWLPVTARLTARAATALLMSLLLGGCATSTTPPPSDTAQFGNSYNYLPVNDVPRDPHEVLSVEQQEKLRNELMAVRDRQAPGAAKAAPGKPAAAKPAAPKPAAPKLNTAK